MQRTAAKTVLVLGAGIGGLVAANELRKKLPKQHRVVVIDRSSQHLLPFTLLWLMSGERQAERTGRRISEVMLPGIEVVQGEIEGIEPGSRSVRVNGRTLGGDYLVISLGAEMVPEIVPGLAAGGYDLYTVKGAEALRGALDAFSGGRVALVVSKPPYRCPAAPYEAAMLLEHYFRKCGIRDRVKVNLYAGEPGPMGIAGQHVSSAVKDMLARKAIRYHPNHGIDRVNPVARMLHFENGHSTEYDLLAFVAPHRVPQLVVRSGLANEGDWIQVDKFSLQTRHPGVYAIGDITTIPLAVGKPLPKAGVFAQGQAEVVAHNIAVEVTGQGEPTRFTGYGDCLIEMGDGIGGFASGDFYAEPAPQISLHTPGPHWHLAKLLYEKAWLRRLS